MGESGTKKGVQTGMYKNTAATQGTVCYHWTFIIWYPARHAHYLTHSHFQLCSSLAFAVFLLSSFTDVWNALVLHFQVCPRRPHLWYWLCSPCFFSKQVSFFAKNKTKHLMYFETWIPANSRPGKFDILLTAQLKFLNYSWKFSFIRVMDVWWDLFTSIWTKSRY